MFWKCLCIFIILEYKYKKVLNLHEKYYKILHCQTLLGTKVEYFMIF